MCCMSFQKDQNHFFPIPVQYTDHKRVCIVRQKPSEVPQFIYKEMSEKKNEQQERNKNTPVNAFVAMEYIS